MDNSQWLQKQRHFDWMQKCLICWKLCEEFIAWSIQNNENIQIINACRDTAEMCSQCIKFEAQGSPFFEQLCGVCAKICETCALKIEKQSSQNEIAQQTLSSCKTLMLSCQEIIGKYEKESAKM